NFDLINSPNYYHLSTIPKMYGGRDYTLSADIEYKNARPGDQRRIGIEVKIIYEDGETSFKGLWKYLESDIDNFNGRISTTFKTADKRVKSVSSLILYTNLIESDYARISNPQLEEGKEVSPYKRSLNDLFKENENGINELVDVNQIKSKNVYTIEDFSSLNNYTYFDMEKLLKYKGPVEDSVYKLTKKTVDATPPVYSYENNQNQQIIKNGESYTASIYVKNDESNDKTLNSHFSFIWYDYNTEVTGADKIKSRVVMYNNDIPDWTRISITYKNDSGKDQDKMTPLFYGFRDAGQTIYFTGLQIEKNSVATEWEPNLPNKIMKNKVEALDFIKKSNKELQLSINDVDKVNIDNNDFYTLSMDVKINEINDLSTKSLYSGYLDKDGNYTSSKNVYYLPLNGNELYKTFRAFFIFYLRDIDNINSFVVRAGYSREQSEKNDMSFSRFKLEKGKISTPYSVPVNKVENLIIDPEI